MKSRWLAYGLLGFLWLGLSCKGGGGQSFLEVVETAPDRDSVDVIVDIRVRVRMDAAIDPNTLSAQTFFLTDSGGNVVPGTVQIFEEPLAPPNQIGTAAELILDESLPVESDFTATVTTGLRSRDGLGLEEDYQWSFTTIEAAWGEDEWIEPLGDWASRQQTIAVDQQLNAVAVWQLDDRAEPTSSTFIVGNRYTRTELWGEQEPIDDGNGAASRPMVAMDGPGNAFVVWERGSLVSSDQEIWTNRYDVEQGAWQGPELLQTGDITRAKLPAVAAEPAGDAMAIYVQVDPEDPQKEILQGIPYDAGSGWGNAETVATSEFNIIAAITDLGMDDQGGAVAIWDPPGVGQGVRLLAASHYTPASGWSEPVFVKDDATTAAGFRLDVGANGDAFAIWRQGNGSDTDPRDDIWAARFSGGTWGAPERIDTHDTGDKTEPDIAVDGAGVAYATWSQTDADFNNIYVAEYSPGDGWGDPVLIEPPAEELQDDGDAATPRIEVNRVGLVFVVWRQVFDQWPSIWSNERDPGESWVAADAERIEEFPEAANSPEIVVDEGRHAHSIWVHGNSSGPKIRTNRFE